MRVGPAAPGFAAPGFAAPDQARGRSASASGARTSGGAPCGRFMMARSAPASRYAAAAATAGPGTLVGVDAHVDRAGDLGRVAAQALAVLDQGLLEAGPLAGIRGDRVPLLGPARGGAQRPLPAPAADRDRRMGPLHRLGLATGVGQVQVLAVERGRGVAEQPDDDLDALVEAVHALLQRRQRDAVRVALLLVPARAEPDLEPALGDDVDGRGHVGQHRRMAVDHARDLAADPDPPGGLPHGGQHRPALDVGPGGIPAQRVEVVPVPGRLEQVDLIGREPHVAHLRPRLVLGPGLDGKAHSPSPHPRASACSTGCRKRNRVVTRSGRAAGTRRGSASLR